MSICRKLGHVICFDGPKEFELTKRAIIYGHEIIIELLNKFLQEQDSYDRYAYINNNRFVLEEACRLEPYVRAMPPEIVLSKSYQFVEWLVSQGHIDLVNLTCTCIRHTDILDLDYSWYDRLLMILAIQDNPITFLLKYLK